MSEKNIEPEIAKLSEFLSITNEESDRGAALASAAMLDERLKDILLSFLADVPARRDLLEGFNAPLGTFSARCSAAYALGLLEENEFQEITLIRKIRNEFGHSWTDARFDRGRVADLTANLPWLGPKEHEAEATLRARFNAAVAILLTDLLWRARLVSRERRTIRKWPNKSGMAR